MGKEHLGQAFSALEKAGKNQDRSWDGSQTVDLDLTYAPPFSPVYDPAPLAARKKK